MRLLPTTLVLAGTLLAWAPTASADGRMCMVVPEMSMLEGQASFFESPASLSPRLAADDTAPREVMWCQSADDPRCMPVRRDSERTTELVDGPLRSPGPTHDDVANASATDVQIVGDDTHPSAGVSRRVERPPRA